MPPEGSRKQVMNDHRKFKKLNSVHPEIGKFGRDQGARKILPQA
jgi:hypothetical protein